MNILADASLPGLKEAFPSPFNLTLYRTHEEVTSLLKHQDILLCRANLKVNQTLLNNHQLHYVATASSGSDHIDHRHLKLKNSTVIDAKGCNAIAVTDYVISSLAYLDSIHLIKGSKIGIIGFGHVGAQVYNRLKAADFELFCYDPPKAYLDNAFKTCSPEMLYQCDVLCIHAELHDASFYPSRGLINSSFLSKLKSSCVIINASRGGIVDEEAILNTPLTYCTDVYLNEPKIDQNIINRSTLCTPHIAGHSLEAKFAAVSIVSKKIHSLLNLPVPQEYAIPMGPNSRLNIDQSWQDLALSLYNPIYETQELKKTLDIEEAFLQLRRNHVQRHDFYTYLDHEMKPKLKEILGAH
jgi:erythronate-4-phosphate dehydrogenase